MVIQMIEPKFNAHDVYHFICKQPMGASTSGIIANFGFSGSEAARICNTLFDLGLITIKLVPVNLTRVLSKSEIEELEKFTGE